MLLVLESHVIVEWKYRSTFCCVLGVVYCWRLRYNRGREVKQQDDRSKRIRETKRNVLRRKQKQVKGNK